MSAFLLANALLSVAASRHLIMTADPGYYSGESEGHLVMEAMQSRVNVSTKAPMCAEAVEGVLGGHVVALITTGIGHDNAASCMVDILSLYDSKGDTIEDIMYLGTSGWTPRRGGFYDPPTDPTCSEDRSGNPELIGIGDVCISPFTFLQNCGFCVWNEDTVGECSAPECTRHNDSTVFGRCSYATDNRDFADSVMKTAQAVSFDARPTKLNDYLEVYWSSMWGGLGLPTSPRPAATPNVYDYHTCAESASYDLWSGIPYDYRCRKTLSTIISSATNKDVSTKDVICVSAMEGPGWVSVLTKRAEKTGKAIPFVNIRAASNYDVWPVSRGPSDTLIRNQTWLPASKTEDFTIQGYKYAISTASKVVLQHFGVSF